jgi:DNA-binding NtrC family response regulator
METVVDHFHKAGALSKLVGGSPLFLKAISQIPAISKSDASVLIRGETGTGKELVARAIHYMSGRDRFPFVALNCGSFPDTLFEDELFGHERGAFTGAHARRDGLIAQAKKGSLFLDEVDTLSQKAQVDLLRVLQDKRYRTIGSATEQEADLRILAATNAALEDLIRAGRFRADLYYRLCIFSVELPPLRERTEDILRLAAHFLEKHRVAYKPAPRLSAAASAALLSWDWQGNVRELENAILRAVHLCSGDAIEIVDLGLQLRAEKSSAAEKCSGKSLTYSAAKRQAIAMFEKDYLTRLIAEQDGNITQAARIAGKDRSDLGKLLKKHSLNRHAFRVPLSSSR